LENNENILSYCPYCKIKKTNDSLHCVVCDHCVDGFDHHCFWINNCIGRNNYFMFIIFLFLLVLNLFLNIFVSIHCNIIDKKAIVIIDDEESLSNFSSKLPLVLLYSRNSKFTISVFIMCISLIFIVPILFLIGMQIQNHFSPKEVMIGKNSNTVKSIY
jgi:hypothetical protein